MNEELLKQAMSLFDSIDKWAAFIELINKNGDIQNRWRKKLKQEVVNRERFELGNEWDISIDSNGDFITWFIRDATINSINIGYADNHLRVFYEKLDTEKVNELIKNPRFDKIKQCFDRIDGQDNATIAWETNNFYFDTPYDGNFSDTRLLAWFAGNRTEEFADQLINKVRKFQTPEITELFREINLKCKKD